MGMNLAMEMHRAFLAGKSVVRKWKFPHLESTLCCKALKTIAKPLGGNESSNAVHVVVFDLCYATCLTCLVLRIAQRVRMTSDEKA